MVCPPDTSRVKKGKAGSRSWRLLVLDSRACTRRGVRAWACMWLIPSSGTCHATAKPFAVCNPVERLGRRPGPRVMEMKSGFFLWTHWFAVRTGIEGEVQPLDVAEAGGSERNASTIKGARCALCDCRDTTGWIPRYSALSAVTFSWKWSCAEDDVGEFKPGAAVSRTATEVSSLGSS